MAKVTREHFIHAQKNGWDDKKIATVCGVSKQAVYQMRKKYFPPVNTIQPVTPESNVS
jgi:hypothetical protein